MIALIQRVMSASVLVSDQMVASIEQGLLVLVGVEKTDTEDQAMRLADKLLAYRVFSDEQGKMNRSLLEVQGEILLVPQFTLLADTARGLRPSFSRAAPPAMGQLLFECLVSNIESSGLKLGCGEFGADMKVSLVNDGPVTFWLQV